MTENLTFTFEDGETIYDDVTVYALSTCGFCRQALKFLRENNIAFRYLYIDELAPDRKQQVKESLNDTYKKRVAFPFLIVDGECHVGFNSSEWKELFNRE